VAEQSQIYYQDVYPGQLIKCCHNLETILISIM